jgi:hypothetical protein
MEVGAPAPHLFFAVALSARDVDGAEADRQRAQARLQQAAAAAALAGRAGKWPPPARPASQRRPCATASSSTRLGGNSGGRRSPRWAGLGWSAAAVPHTCAHTRACTRTHTRTHAQAQRHNHTLSCSVVRAISAMPSTAALSAFSSSARRRSGSAAAAEGEGGETPSAPLGPVRGRGRAGTWAGGRARRGVGWGEGVLALLHPLIPLPARTCGALPHTPPTLSPAVGAAYAHARTGRGRQLLARDRPKARGRAGKRCAADRTGAYSTCGGGRGWLPPILASGEEAIEATPSTHRRNRRTLPR